MDIETDETLKSASGANTKIDSSSTESNQTNSTSVSSSQIDTDREMTFKLGILLGINEDDPDNNYRFEFPATHKQKQRTLKEQAIETIGIHKVNKINQSDQKSEQSASALSLVRSRSVSRYPTVLPNYTKKDSCTQRECIKRDGHTQPGSSSSSHKDDGLSSDREYHVRIEYYPQVIIGDVPQNQKFISQPLQVKYKQIGSDISPNLGQYELLTEHQHLETAEDSRPQLLRTMHGSNYHPETDPISKYAVPNCTYRDHRLKEKVDRLSERYPMKPNVNNKDWIISDIVSNDYSVKYNYYLVNNCKEGRRCHCSRDCQSRRTDKILDMRGKGILRNQDLLSTPDNETERNYCNSDSSRQKTVANIGSSTDEYCDKCSYDDYSNHNNCNKYSSKIQLSNLPLVQQRPSTKKKDPMHLSSAMKKRLDPSSARSKNSQPRLPPRPWQSDSYHNHMKSRSAFDRHGSEREMQPAKHEHSQRDIQPPRRNHLQREVQPAKREHSHRDIQSVKHEHSDRNMQPQQCDHSRQSAINYQRSSHQVPKDHGPKHHHQIEQCDSKYNEIIRNNFTEMNAAHKMSTSPTDDAYHERHQYRRNESNQRKIPEMATFPSYQGLEPPSRVDQSHFDQSSRQYLPIMSPQYVGAPRFFQLPSDPCYPYPAQHPCAPFPGNFQPFCSPQMTPSCMIQESLQHRQPEVCYNDYPNIPEPTVHRPRSFNGLNSRSGNSASGLQNQFVGESTRNGQQTKEDCDDEEFEMQENSAGGGGGRQRWSRSEHSFPVRTKHSIDCYGDIKKLEQQQFTEQSSRRTPSNTQEQLNRITAALHFLLDKYQTTLDIFNMMRADLIDLKKENARMKDITCSSISNMEHRICALEVRVPKKRDQQVKTQGTIYERPNEDKPLMKYGYKPVSRSHHSMTTMVITISPGLNDYYSDDRDNIL